MSDRLPASKPKQLAPRTLQIAGLVLIFGSAIFWALTSRESGLLLGAGVTLATLAWLQRAIQGIQERLPMYEQELTEKESAPTGGTGERPPRGRS